jgi:hypothetical protein
MKAIILLAVTNAVFPNQSKLLYNVLNEPERERERDRHLVLPQVRVTEGRVNGESQENGPPQGYSINYVHNVYREKFRMYRVGAKLM